MLLYLLRHGIAEDHAEGGDANRRLTQQGTFQVAMIAKALQKLNTRFDLVMTSPYIRARETADIIVRITRFRGDIEEDRRLVPGARYEHVSELVAERADATSMLLVGHQPAIGEFIGGICADSPIDIEVMPASVRLIEISQFRPQARGTLIWTVTPTVVEAIMS